jgi:choloylglycine hydrolase
MTKTSFGRKMTAMIAACGLLMAIPADLAQACTGIRLIAADGSVVHARTLEFAIDIHSNVLVIPRGYERTATAPDDKAGLKWKAKYASVGASALGLPILVDGLNEAGLAVGLFYFPTTAGYMPYSPGDAGKAIAPWELGSWLLDNFASVDEVKANIGAIVVPATVFKGWGFAPPVHAIVHDASGKSVVIEYVGGKLNLYESPLGVITNSPGFDWQMTNLRNYVNFSLDNVHPVQLGPVKLEPFGQGSGMLGMPGERPLRASSAPSPSAIPCSSRRPATTRCSKPSTSSTISTSLRARRAKSKRTSTATSSPTTRYGPAPAISTPSASISAPTKTARSVWWTSQK